MAFRQSAEGIRHSRNGDGNGSKTTVRPSEAVHSKRNGSNGRSSLRPHLPEPETDQLKATGTAKKRSRGDRRILEKNLGKRVLIGQRVVLGIDRQDSAIAVGRLTGIGSRLVELEDVQYCSFAHGTIEYMHNDLNTLQKNDCSRHLPYLVVSRKSIEYLIPLKDVDRC